MTTVPATPGGPPVALMGDVTADTSCRKCAYNLRGLPVGGRCPECGTPVGVSVNGELLCYSDPEYLETLRRGVHFILWGVLAAFVFTILGVVVRRASPVTARLLILAASVPSIIGGWLLTVPDPGGIGESQYGTARKTIRIALVIGATNTLFDIAMSSAHVAPPAALALRTIGFLAAVVGLVGQFAQLAYLRKLALRIPDPRLSKNANEIMWGLGISYGASIPPCSAPAQDRKAFLTWARTGQQ